MQAWRRLVNPFRPLEILSADEVEAVHRASLRILREIGVEVLGDRALDLLERAARAWSVGRRPGQRRRSGSTRPRSRSSSHWRPPTFALHARNPERTSCSADGTSSSARSAGRRS